MTAPTRIAIAVLIAAIGLVASDQVRRLVVLANTDSARLGFEMMGIGFALASVAIASAWALPGRVADHLGLRASRLPIGAVIALVVGALGLAHAINAALSGTEAVERSVVTGISRGVRAARDGDFAIALIGTVIAPAVGEELLCRGLLQRCLVRLLGPVAAVLLASLAFGWLHAELLHGLVATSIGCYLGIAAYWCDSTRPAIAGHAANNLLALLASTGVLAVGVPGPRGIAVGLAVAGIGLYWASRARTLRGTESAEPAALQPERDSADA